MVSVRCVVTKLNVKYILICQTICLQIDKVHSYSMKGVFVWVIKNYSNKINIFTC